MSSRKKKSRGGLSEEMKACKAILTSLQKHRSSGDFLAPVDWKAFNLPDYPQIIKNPMDLGTIEDKLLAGRYSSPDDFAADVRLVWTNAQTYNLEGSEIFDISVSLSKFFEGKFSKQFGSSRSGTKRKIADVTRTDRVTFSMQIPKLSSEQLGQMVDIIQTKCPAALTEEKDEIEIEINNIHAELLVELNEYAAKCISKSADDKRKKRK